MQMLAAFVISVVILLVSLILTTRSKKQEKKMAPEAGNSWPIIGHLHLLITDPNPTHITFSNMADKYGPIFTIKQGMMHRALVVSNWEIAKECLTTNDKAFANRPKILAMELLSNKYANMGFASQGPHWRLVRRLVTQELLSSERIKSYKHARESAVREALNELHGRSSKKTLVDMRRWFGDKVYNLLLGLVVGKRDSNDEEESLKWRKMCAEFFELGEKFTVSDAFPFLRWLDIGGYEKAMKKIAKEMDGVGEEWLKEHKQRRSSSIIISSEKESARDFMDVMLSVVQDSEEHDADTVIKSICLELVMAGAESSIATLTWALSHLLNNRDAMRNVQRELDMKVGKNRKVEESDMTNLVYLEAVIKETLRLYPVPLALPHQSMEDCTVSGYHIPKGTTLFINLYKLHRDPRVWAHPYEFRPERFLTTNIDVRGQNFELIPFSSGRRMCPGFAFALEDMQLTLASLLHEFEIRTPLDQPVDITEGGGLSSLKATPLQVLIYPRLP